MKPKVQKLLRRGIVVSIIAGGVTALALLVFLPTARPEAHDEVDPTTHTALNSPARGIKEYVKPQFPVSSVKTGLTGEMFRKIPSFFELAFSVNISAFNTFFWAHSLFTLARQPSLRRELDSLKLSLNGITTAGVGLLPRSNVVSWSRGSLTMTMPPLTFVFEGRRGRLEALRTYWKKNEGGTNMFRQGNFQLGFPLGPKPHFFVGTYRTSITPVMQLAEKPDAGFDLCGAMGCKKRIEALGLIPDAIILYLPRTPYRIRGNMAIKSMVSALELNPDGVLFRSSIVLTVPCREGAARLKKFLRRRFSSLKYKQSFVERALVQCPKKTEILITISSSSSEIRSHIIQLGLLPQ
ncbi:hypothetical protein KKF84_17260 [Myxococcota bacterium]|nr:hypothetical protein [Myxococcota bacterium]